jgi:hypothetical protein
LSLTAPQLVKTFFAVFQLHSSSMYDIRLMASVAKVKATRWRKLSVSIGRSAPASWPETGFGSLAFFVDDHTERGAGGREYGTSEKDKQTLTG